LSFPFFPEPVEAGNAAEAAAAARAGTVAVRPDSATFCGWGEKFVAKKLKMRTKI
jgi:hypothetical protein